MKQTKIKIFIVLETFENINYRQNHNWFEAWFDQRKFDQRGQTPNGL